MNLFENWPLPAESSAVKQNKRRATLVEPNVEPADSGSKSNLNQQEGKSACNSKVISKKTTPLQKKSVSWAASEFIKAQADDIKQLLFQPADEKENNKEEKTQNTVGDIKISEPAQQARFGSSFIDFCGLTWSDPAIRWLWVPKGDVIRFIDQGIGFQATPREIKQSGWAAKKVVRSRAKVRDYRLFVEVVREMHRWSDHGDRSSYRRDDGGRQAHEGRRGFPPRQDSDGRVWNNRGTYASEDSRFTAQDSRCGDFQRGSQSSNTMGKRVMNDREVDYVESDLRNKIVKQRDGRGERFESYDNRRKESFDTDSSIICYNCRQTGHHQSTCSNPPFCYNCKRTGHKAVLCPVKKGIAMYGYGFPHALFQSISFPAVERPQKNELMGKLSILEGVGSEKAVKDELNFLFADKKEWKIKEIHNKEYLITFPDKITLGLITRFNTFKFQYEQITAQVREVDPAEKKINELVSAWFRVYNWPGAARDEVIAKGVSELAGELDEIDMRTLHKDCMGPVRMKIAVRDPALIHGTTEVHFNRVGVNLEWEWDAQRSEEKHKNDKFDRHREREDEEDYENDDLLDEDYKGYGKQKQISADNKLGVSSSSKGNMGGKQQTNLTDESPGKVDGDIEDSTSEDDILDSEPSPSVVKREEKRKVKTLEEVKRERKIISEDINREKADNLTTDSSKNESSGSQQKEDMAKLDTFFEEKIEKMAKAGLLPVQGKKKTEEKMVLSDEEKGSQVISDGEEQETAINKICVAGKRSARRREDGRTIQAIAEEKKAKSNEIEMEGVVERKRQRIAGKAGGVR